jgi:uncharacterized protein YjbI with pentapeptide repeats
VTRVPQWTGFSRKTLWDWLQLLIVPAILIGVTFVWSATQTRSDNKREDRRIFADRAAAEEARRDATLQAYLEEMSGLMLNKKLLTSKSSDAVRQVARTVTLTALHRLDGQRTVAVLHFLYEARLIDRRRAVVSLKGADFSLIDADGEFFSGADLDGAKLTGALLIHSNLDRASLSGAELIGAALVDSDLKRADLSEANFGGAKLMNAKLSYADLAGADLGATNLSGAELIQADLTGANLTDADLTNADLTGADLTGADLEEADLSGVTGLDLARFITDLSRREQAEFLHSQASFLDSLSSEELAKFNLSPEKLASPPQAGAATTRSTSERRAIPMRRTPEPTWMTVSTSAGTAMF